VLLKRQISHETSKAMSDLLACFAALRDGIAMNLGVLVLRGIQREAGSVPVDKPEGMVRPIEVGDSPLGYRQKPRAEG